MRRFPAASTVFVDLSSSAPSTCTRTSFFSLLRQCSFASSAVSGHGASLRFMRYVSFVEKSHSAVARKFVTKSMRSDSLRQ